MNNKMSKKSKDKKDFNKTYQRFQSKLQDYEIKIDILRQEKEENELKGVTLTPRINTNSRQIIKNTKSFLERQASFENKRKEKNKKMILEKQKKEEEICAKTRNVNKDINTFLTHCTEWENKKKEKLIQLKKEKEKKEIKASSNRKPRPSEADIQISLKRLYKDDVIKRKQNQSVLASIFTPSFIPNINKRRTKIDKSKDKLNRTDMSIDISYDLDLSMEQMKIQNNEHIQKAFRNKLFKPKPHNKDPLLNKTCNIILSKKDDNSSTAACSKKKIKMIK